MNSVFYKQFPFTVFFSVFDFNKQLMINVALGANETGRLKTVVALTAVPPGLTLVV